VDKYSPLEHVVTCIILRVVHSFAEGLMALLQELGTAYLHLSQFNCRKAIECLNNLQPKQYNTGWVLSLLGKAYYELTEYQQAVR
jgi:anaphase-promoting complex subunit 3